MGTERKEASAEPDAALIDGAGCRSAAASRTLGSRQYTAWCAVFGVLPAGKAATERTNIYPRSALDSKPGGNAYCNNYVFGGRTYRGGRNLFNALKPLIHRSVDIDSFRARLIEVNEDVELTDEEVRLLCRKKGERKVTRRKDVYA